MGEGEKRKFLSFSSLLFSLPSFPFSPETLDTQAIRIFKVRTFLDGVTYFYGILFRPITANGCHQKKLLNFYLFPV